MIMGNTHIIFLHIQIEYLKCEFWEFESTQKDLWLFFLEKFEVGKGTVLLFLLYVIYNKFGVETNLFD